jgi:hypothetical protein
MREAEVREYIGEKNWGAFIKWMGGQTVSSYPNGEIDYYDWDVEAFKTRLETGYDRQSDPLAWD